MTSRADVARILRKEVLDIHGVAEVTGMSRSSVNALLTRPSAGFPTPVYETCGDHRHPVRLWYRADVENWNRTRRRRSRAAP
jgi:hypothetical protein